MALITEYHTLKECDGECAAAVKPGPERKTALNRDWKHELKVSTAEL
jgi:hypothetical protein